MKKILFFINEDWFFWTHRLSLARYLKNEGFEIHLATRTHKLAQQIEDEGFILHTVNLDRKNRNPFIELYQIVNLFFLFKKINPDILHNTTLKHVIYGTFIARLAGIKNIVNGIPGLGSLYSENNFRSRMTRKIVSGLYRFVFGLQKRSTFIIFENHDDRSLFVNLKILLHEQAIVILGMGCDIGKFKVTPETNKIPAVMMAGRLLKNKGVYYLVKAIQNLNTEGISCKLVLVGEPDLDNKLSLTREELEMLNNDPMIDWLGRQENMPELMAQASIIALPTYYGEGLPKVLIEGAASGRPLVTTDIPGCREIVIPNVNGFLVPTHDIEALTQALKTLILDENLRKQMGLQGRKLVEEGFTDYIVNRATLAVYSQFSFQNTTH